MKRKCTKCNKWKSYDNFAKEKRTKIGLQSRCKKCINEYTKTYWYKNHEKNLKKKKLYRKKNKVVLSNNAKKRYWNNIEESRQKGRDTQKRAYQRNKEKLKEKSRIYAKSNRQKILVREREWALKNPEKYKAKNRRHNIKRKLLVKIDGRVRLSTRISNLIRQRLKARFGSKNQKHRKNYLPYTIDELMIHLEKQFSKGMSWKNYGRWHLDHIIPDSFFNYSSVEDDEFQKCWALNNLQPLWAVENRRKGAKLLI